MKGNSDPALRNKWKCIIKRGVSLGAKWSHKSWVDCCRLYVTLPIHVPCKKALTSHPLALFSSLSSLSLDVTGNVPNCATQRSQSATTNSEPFQEIEEKKKKKKQTKTKHLCKTALGRVRKPRPRQTYVCHTEVSLFCFYKKNQKQQSFIRPEKWMQRCRI